MKKALIYAMSMPKDDVVIEDKPPRPAAMAEEAFMVDPIVKPKTERP